MVARYGLEDLPFDARRIAACRATSRSARVGRAGIRGLATPDRWTEIHRGALHGGRVLRRAGGERPHVPGLRTRPRAQRLLGFPEQHRPQTARRAWETEDRTRLDRSRPPRLRRTRFRRKPSL